MKSQNLFCFFVFFFIVLSSSLTSTEEFGYGITEEIPINYSLIPTVNSSDYWDDLNSPSDIFFNDLSPSNIDITGYEITVENITATGYIFGQPLEGYLGSGIIWAEEVNENGNLNVSIISGLNVKYPGFVMRLVKTDNTVKYCNIPSGSVTVPDDAHSVYYVDNDCNIQFTTIQNYITTDLSPGGIADFFNAISHSGSVEILEGSGLMNKEDIKIRKNTFKLTSLNVVSGMGIIQEGFPNISVTSGEYSYINEIFTTSAQNTSDGDTIELVYRQGGNWQYSDQTGLNLTWCDDGTNSAECSNPSKYRRYIIGLLGRNDSTDTTKLHQLAASETETYPNLASCLDISANPVSFDLPSNYKYGFVLLYAYCGRAADNGWVGGFIDLRATTTEVATGAPDLSIFLTRDGSRTLTDNWNVGGFNITNISYLQAQTLNITGNAYIGDLIWNGNLDLGGNNITNIDWINGFNMINGSGNIVTTNIGRFDGGIGINTDPYTDGNSIIDAVATSGGATIYVKSASGSAAGLAAERPDGVWVRLHAGSGASLFLFEQGTQFWITEASSGTNPYDDTLSGNDNFLKAYGGATNKIEILKTLDMAENTIDDVGDIIHDDATASDWTLKNIDQDKDIIFSVNDGGVTKSITLDADVFKLVSSTGTFDFDNDNINTTGTLFSNEVVVGDPSALGYYRARVRNSAGFVEMSVDEDGGNFANLNFRAQGSSEPGVFFEMEDDGTTATFLISLLYAQDFRNVASIKWQDNKNMFDFFKYTSSSQLTELANGKIDIDSSGNIKQEDNLKHYFGTGDDASITYNGTDMVINPAEVGLGKLYIEGGLSGNYSVGPCWIYFAGGIAYSTNCTSY